MVTVYDDMPEVLRRADGFVLHLIGGDAIVESPNAPALHLPGEGERLRFLWDLLDEPRQVGTLIAALRGPVASDIIRQLIDVGALTPWPLATRLAQLHGVTVTPATRSPVGPGWEDARLMREYTGAGGCDLPMCDLSADLATALNARRTVRTFSGAALSLAELSTLLRYGAGSPVGPALPRVAGGPPGGRTYPSAGALYPVEVLVRPIHVESLRPAHYRYQVLAHRLVDVTAPIGLPAVIDRMFADNQVSGASLAFLLWVDFIRPSLGKYGEKAYRLALLEAGHLGQNLLLVAAALGLGGVPLCGFDDEALARDAGLAYPEQAIVYALGVGVPATPVTASVEER